MGLRFYAVILEPAEKGGYGVVFPDLPGCVTVSRDAEEATRGALEALLLHIEGMIEEGLLARIDRVAELRGQTRSAFFAEAARRALAEGREAA